MDQTPLLQDLLQGNFDAHYHFTLWFTILTYCWEQWILETKVASTQIPLKTLELFKSISKEIRSFSSKFDSIMGLWIVNWLDSPMFKSIGEWEELERTKMNYHRMGLFLKDLCEYIPELIQPICSGLREVIVGGLEEKWSVHGWKNVDGGFSWDDSVDNSKKKLLEFVRSGFLPLIPICLNIPSMKKSMCEIFVSIDVIFKGAMWRVYGNNFAKLLRMEKFQSIYMMRSQRMNSSIQSQIKEHMGERDGSTVYEFMDKMNVFE